MTTTYLDGQNVAPKTAKQARALIGKKVTYLTKFDIDRSGRGYFFPRTGVIREVHGKNVDVGHHDWIMLSSIVEMVVTE